MAYAFTVTATRTFYGTKPGLLLRVEETDCGAADEWTYYDAALWLSTYTLHSIFVQPTAGAAANVAPVLGRAAAFTPPSDDTIATYSSGAYLDDDTPVILRGADTGIFGRSTPDAGSDNTIVTEILLIESAG